MGAWTKVRDRLVALERLGVLVWLHCAKNRRHRVVGGAFYDSRCFCGGRFLHVSSKGKRRAS